MPQALQPLATNDRPHRGITGEPLGVVDVLVAGEPAEHRLPKQAAQGVTRILTASAVEELSDCDIGELEGIVEFTVSEQATIGTEPGAMEFEPDPAVEHWPQRRLSGFTRRVPHHQAP
jgi:hypothetical protein